MRPSLMSSRLINSFANGTGCASARSWQDADP